MRWHRLAVMLASAVALLAAAPVHDCIIGKIREFRADWDSVFAERLGRNPRRVAAGLLARISPAQRARWSRGAATGWAHQSYRLARAKVYGMLPRPLPDGRYRLPRCYVREAVRVVALQLSRAGVQLAVVLNRALSATP